MGICEQQARCRAKVVIGDGLELKPLDVIMPSSLFIFLWIKVNDPYSIRSGYTSLTVPLDLLHDTFRASFSKSCNKQLQKAILCPLVQ